LPVLADGLHPREYGYMPQIHVYIPDDLAEALAAHKDMLNVSGICQHALREEITMIEAVAGTEFEVHELRLESKEGTEFLGRLTATEIANNVFLTEEGNLVWYDERRLAVEQLGDDLDDGRLRDLLSEDDYIEVMGSLGRTPVIDLEL
jgi:hypothetical protein